MRITKGKIAATAVMGTAPLVISFADQYNAAHVAMLVLGLVAAFLLNFDFQEDVEQVKRGNSTTTWVITLFVVVSMLLLVAGIPQLFESNTARFLAFVAMGFISQLLGAVMYAQTVAWAK